MIGAALLGTPRSAVPTLEALAGLIDLRAVITRPDRPRGRGRRPAPPEAKAAAHEQGIPVWQPSSPDELDAIVGRLDLDVVVVVSYGMILPGRTLARPRRGVVNLHFSLLPRWRGAAPVERAILAGDPTTGVTLMEMEERLDSGGVLAAWETSIGDDETAGALTDRLAAGGAELLGLHIEAFVEGCLVPVPQDESAVTWARRLSTEEAVLDFSRPAEEVVRTIRAFCPRPGAHTTWRGGRFKIYRGQVVPGELVPGRVEFDAAGVRVGTGAGCVELVTVQPAGRKAIDARQWIRGVKGDQGRLG